MGRRQEHIIYKIVGEIRKQLDLKYPLDIMDLIVNKMNGKVDLETFSDSTVRSKVKLEGDSFHLYISDSERDSQYLLAKDLGHLILHLGYFIKENPSVTEYTDSPLYRQGYSLEDSEAEIFAQELLLPEEEFVSTLENDPESVTKVFGVSDLTVTKRRRWLGI